MKLTELLEQCESDNTAASLLAKQRLRYHAAEVIPELVNEVRKVIKWHDKFPQIGDVGNCQCRQCRFLKPVLAAAEEVKDRSEQLTPTTKPQTTMP